MPDSRNALSSLNEAASEIELDAPVREYLPDFAGGQKDRVTVRHLLTHTSGLPGLPADFYPQAVPRYGVPAGVFGRLAMYAAMTPERLSPDTTNLLVAGAVDVIQKPNLSTRRFLEESAALARFGDTPCVLLAQDRRGQDELHPLGPGALREARRGMRLAEELQLPLLTIIDTPGAALSVEAEEGGLAGEIARCLADLVTLEAPTLCLLLAAPALGRAALMDRAARSSTALQSG